ncbi:MAG: PorP/SprF family type IX secretion system membrane protein [Flavisolibacter sp.]|nr:PorP/SprF family type IX secretion system membrane protein [Flavisolibacter sp.]MBD0296044.1 PorP/SprF family type IX secretion system membrane protein [Flavisolibacter sp.]MBD0351180.1 PorP/SprF family type IX secretion system membrane protein [Flavisolibacter sp.]MBD0365824.1 PorP/SprF family type IX secretion system membrane protein [Flavisolibacter sp.]MBD0375174.1 PorP/SprF family type IX secretion system membrane protein [Flavisolibacter sp.]
MKLRLFFTAFVASIASLMVTAQDPNFSQFFASPLTLNPASTGKFDGNFRVAANFRNQWPTINNAFTTATISFDAGILKNRLPEIDQFGVGIMAFSDKSGNGILQNNYLALSAAYHKGLDENGYHQIGAGFQGTYVNKRLDITRLKFEDQLTSQGFTGVTSEIFTQQQVNITYFDMNAGLFYNGTTNGFNNFYLGASAYHLNRPKESFHGGAYFLQPRLTIQGGGRVPSGDYNAFHFSANYSRQAAATNTIFGGAYSLNLNNTESIPTNLYLGAWYRLGDAVIPYIGLEFGDFHIGATYDVNTSGLKPASNMRGGAEFSLIYIKQPSDPNHKRLSCPKF